MRGSWRGARRGGSLRADSDLGEEPLDWISCPGQGTLLDNLSIALCISIGTGVPWLIAVYSDNGARQLIGNSVFGMLGITFGARVFNWISPTYSIVALVSVGPLIAFLTIVAGQAAKRAILSKLLRPPH